MASRFQLLSNDDFEKLSKNAENKNTNKSTNNWIRVYKQWAGERLKNENLELDKKHLDEVLFQFYAEKMGRSRA